MFREWLALPPPTPDIGTALRSNEPPPGRLDCPTCPDTSATALVEAGIAHLTDLSARGPPVDVTLVREIVFVDPSIEGWLDLAASLDTDDDVLVVILDPARDGVEQITDPEKINHELATYNILVPGYQELCATLLIGIDDMQELYRWKPLLVGVNDKLALEVDGERAMLIPDDEGTRDEEPPMVQYLKWVLTETQVDRMRSGEAAVRVGVDHPNYTVWVDADREFVQRLATMIG